MISINLYEILMQIINFGILLFLVNNFLIRPVHKVLKDRAKSIQERVDICESNKQETVKVLQEQKTFLKEARLEAKSIRQGAEEAAEKERERMLVQAQVEADRLILNAKKEIQLQIARAKKELLDEAGQSAVALCSQLLKRKLTVKDQSVLLSQGAK